MSVTFQIPGNIQTFFAAPSNTSAATIYNREAGVDNVVLVGLNITSTTGGAAATVWINDGSTDRLVLDAKAIAANTAELYDFGNPSIPIGGSVKVKDGTGSKLAFALTIAEEYRL
jgi:hypothetical protein